MTKILKKSLACLLVFALCFTAIASCLAVSAAAPVAGFDYKTYFPNDSKVWAVCAGQNVRAQLSMTDLEAGSTIGLSIEIPKGAEITSIDGWNWGTNCQLKEVSKYFNEEDSVVTIIYDVVASGNYMLFVRYNITDAVTKRVHYMDVTFEAAFASDDEITEYTVTDYYEVFDHDVVTDDAVAPGCETTGLTEGSHCSRCGLVLVAQEEVEATGHAWDAGVANPDATCDSEGTLVYTCANDPTHTYTEAISPKGHKPADGLVNNGENHSVVCGVCGVAIETADHDFTDGDCACGAKKPAEGPTRDTTIQQGNSYAAVNDQISLVFLLKHKTVTNAGYDSYTVEFSRKTFDNQYMYNKDLDVQEVQKTTSTSSTSYYQYTGIGMYELNVPITVTVKCYKNGEYVAYNDFVLNVKDMIVNVYNADSTPDSMKTLIVDLLYLGKEAQLYFGTEGTDLATVDLPTKDFNVEQTTTFDLDALATAKNYELGEDYKDSGITASFNLNIAKNPGVYFVIGKMGTSTYPKANITIETSYTNGLNGTLVPHTVNGADATFASSRYYYVFNKVAFYDLNQVVTTTVKQNVGGVEKTVITITYTVESYIKEKYDDELQGDLLIALAKFSKSARYHFIEKNQ